VTPRQRVIYACWLQNNDSHGSKAYTLDTHILISYDQHFTHTHVDRLQRTSFRHRGFPLHPSHLVSTMMFKLQILGCLKHSLGRLLGCCRLSDSPRVCSRDATGNQAYAWCVLSALFLRLVPSYRTIRSTPRHQAPRSSGPSLHPDFLCSSSGGQVAPSPAFILLRESYLQWRFLKRMPHRRTRPSKMTSLPTLLGSLMSSFMAAILHYALRGLLARGKP
jgi:hypothetical protein